MKAKPKVTNPRSLPQACIALPSGSDTPSPPTSPFICSSADGATETAAVIPPQVFCVMPLELMNG